MENLSVIEITCNLLKKHKIKYNVCDDFFELFLGDLEAYIQFEKLDTDLDYTLVQFFIKKEDGNDLYNETIDNGEDILTENIIEDGILELQNQSSIINKGISKIYFLIDKIIDVKDEYSLSLDLIYKIINEKLID